MCIRITICGLPRTQCGGSDRRLRPQRTDVLAHRIECMVDSGDKSDQHVDIGAQAAQIVALGHKLAAEPIQGYVFGQFGHYVGSPYGMARIASQIEQRDQAGAEPIFAAGVNARPWRRKVFCKAGGGSSPLGEIAAPSLLVEPPDRVAPISASRRRAIAGAGSTKPTAHGESRLSLSTMSGKWVQASTIWSVRRPSRSTKHGAISRAISASSTASSRMTRSAMTASSGEPTSVTSQLAACSRTKSWV